MVNLGELERSSCGGGDVDLLFARRVDALKSQARDLDGLRDEIRGVITRTAGYLSHPFTTRDETPQAVALK
jgi:hypothetical protein